MTLGQKVRQARIRAGLTQEQAAGGRITRNMLSLIENDLSAPSMKTLEYLAAALGVTAGWLLADDASDEAAERLPRARAMLREGDHRGCAALLEPGAEQASDEELLLLAVSAWSWPSRRWVRSNMKRRHGAPNRRSAGTRGDSTRSKR